MAGGEDRWDWRLFPGAEHLIGRELEQFLRSSPRTAGIAARIEAGTSTRLFDWVDHLILPGNRPGIREFESAGFSIDRRESAHGATVLRIPGSTLFPVLISDNENESGLALRVDRIEDFLSVFKGEGAVEGNPDDPFRRAGILRDNDCQLFVVERHGSAGFTVDPSRDAGPYRDALDSFGGRDRRAGCDADGISDLRKLIGRLLSGLAPSRLADAFFRSERTYWEKRNRAARAQKSRQDAFGLGWANHDHHTFRSSREQFAALISCLEAIGCTPRERFHAGAQAGWGAQIMEQADCGVLVFADTDLMPEEHATDFAHKGLTASARKGTVGLWVGLHGESALQAGLHHLSSRFAFDALGPGLADRGISMMAPFSDFPFLRQAFSEGEMWKPDPGRVRALATEGAITGGQAAAMISRGAIGSHLENIQRGQGFAGFNQDSVSVIVRATDPRRHLFRGA